MTCGVDFENGEVLSGSFTITVEEGPLWADGACYAKASGGQATDIYFNGYENTAGNATLRQTDGGSCHGPGTPLTVVRVESGDDTEITALCQTVGHPEGVYFKADEAGYTLPADAYVCTG